MMKSAKQQNSSLRARQLDRLERLLTIFQQYQDTHEHAFWYALDYSFKFLGTITSRHFKLTSILLCEEKGLSIDDLFSMDRTMHLENKSGFALEMIIKIYADMEISFQPSSFTYFNLFTHAYKQMRDGQLSSDALTRIIRLVQGRRDSAYSVYAETDAAVSSTQKRPQRSVITERSKDSSYQQSAPPVTTSRGGMFDHQDDSGALKAWAATREGYTSIPDATMK
jgi:hypothetical protein